LNTSFRQLGNRLKLVYRFVPEEGSFEGSRINQRRQPCACLLFCGETFILQSFRVIGYPKLVKDEKL